MHHAQPSGLKPQQWEIEVPILTHPLMLIGVAKLLAIAGLLMWAILAFMFGMQGDWRLIAPVSGLVLISVGVVTLCMMLFCTPQNYAAVMASVRAGHAGHAPKARANPVPRLLLHNLLVIACVPLFHLPAGIDQFAPFLVLCFAMASVWSCRCWPL